MLQQIVEDILKECNKKENREKFEKNIVDPLICYILDRLYPYIFITAVVFVLILMIAIMLFVIMIRNKNIV